MVDVAQAAGVALSTVSRVVNQDPRVGAAIVERVQQTISSLGWEPDERARQLRRGGSATLGAAIRHIGGSGGVISAFQRLARGSRHMVLTAATEDDVELERSVIRAMCSRRVDGLLLEPIGPDHAFLLREISAGLAVVAVDRPAEGIDVDCVVSDSAGGIEAAYAHLSAHGHRHIAYLGDHERIFTGHARAEAFRRCAVAAGAPVDALVHTGEVSQPDSDEWIAAALRSARSGPEPATAFVLGNEMTTLRVLTQLGPDYPAVAVVAFDDLPLAAVLQPGLTVVAQGLEEMGRKAFDLLTARMTDDSLPVRRVVVPTRLVARGSGERAPAGAR